MKLLIIVAALLGLALGMDGDANYAAPIDAGDAGYTEADYPTITARERAILQAKKLGFTPQVYVDKHVFQGAFDAKCGADGFYTVDASSFYTCLAGNPYTYNCPQGFGIGGSYSKGSVYNFDDICLGDFNSFNARFGGYRSGRGSRFGRGFRN